jgi:UDP-GlcNAc:undecaprenyl-phosphate/decaprenyl-phosphate GlcNAc-1-phosphate transferase
MLTLFIAATSVAATFILILLLIRLAPKLHLLDHPGGRKEHARTTPLVGGLGIAIVTIIAVFALQLPHALALTLPILTILSVGIADDIAEIAPLPKFLAQASACLLLIYLVGVKLNTVGNLLGYGSIGMWFFAAPMTVFAVIGVINAINMADGIDGHSGSIALITFTAYAYVAHQSALWDDYRLLLVLAGAVAGFHLLNARWPWNKQARTFLGDTGSMLLGFLIGWFAIELTAGNGATSTVAKTFPAICALWVIVMPLCDCVSLMIRRKLAHRSMFVADRQHLHHYLLNRGFTVGQASLVSAVLNTICALIGVVSWKLGVPEPIMFAAFIALFAAYHTHMLIAFRTMPQHSQMGATPT